MRKIIESRICSNSTVHVKHKKNRQDTNNNNSCKTIPEES